MVCARSPSRLTLPARSAGLFAAGLGLRRIRGMIDQKSRRIQQLIGWQIFA
jgi:hypothetical protein